MEYSSVRQSIKDFRTSAWFWLLICTIGIALLTSLGPAEKSLGVNVRVVYLHGVWVWTALAGLVAAGLAGAAGLIWRRSSLFEWSTALGRTGLFFWITYLPVSLWAMQTNWNGLFLSEPRWRFAVVFAVTGLLLQVGLFFIREPVVYAWGNILYICVLLFMLGRTEEVMHPSSPIFSSESQTIQVYFILLLFLMMMAAWQVARLLYRKFS